MMLENAWYVAAWSKEITQTLTARIILNRSIVLYRRRDGVAIGLENKCPHRNLPLSEGKLADDRIQCAYHGLVFDDRGRCVHIPGQDVAQPDRRLIRTFPIAEKYGWLFVWMGDPSAADVGLLPGFHDKLVDDRWTMSAAPRASNAAIGWCSTIFSICRTSPMSTARQTAIPRSPRMPWSRRAPRRPRSASAGPCSTFRLLPRSLRSPDTRAISIAGRSRTSTPRATSISSTARGRPKEHAARVRARYGRQLGLRGLLGLDARDAEKHHGFWVSTYRKADVSGSMAERFYDNSMKIIDEDVSIYEAQQGRDRSGLRHRGRRRRFEDRDQGGQRARPCAADHPPDAPGGAEKRIDGLECR